MHPRFWVYRRNLSNNPQSPFRSHDNVMQKTGCCMSGILGLLFLGLAVMCLFTPAADRDGKLFLIFMGLFGIFEIISILYCFVPWFYNKCRSSDPEDDRDSISSLVSSEENAYQEFPRYEGIASYQASAMASEVPIYEPVPSYQAGPSFSVPPYYLDGGNIPGLVYCRPLVNYEGVFGYQQIPIYQQDLLEPQLPTYSSKHANHVTSPQKDIHVY